MKIHPMSVISKEAELDSDVEVGPFSVILGHVKIKKGTVIGSQVTIGNPYGRVEIGENNQILSGAMVGGPPQDVSYKNEPTQLIIGDNNIIREFATVNCGTIKGGGVTRIGNHCMLMSYVHVAHDCQFGNHIIVANNTQFAGHVEIEDHVKIGGLSGITQYSKIGRHAYIGGGSHINKDIVPFCIAEGSWARAKATNKVGLSRAGYSKEEIASIYKALKIFIFGDRTIDEIVKTIQNECEQTVSVQQFIEFLRSSKSGVAR